MGNDLLKKDLFSGLSTMSAEVSTVLNLFKARDLMWKPESWEGIPGERFSAIEQICHLRDIEVEGYHFRIEAMLNETNPTLKSIEGYDLAIQHDYANADLSETILSFNSARTKTLTIIGKIQDAQWNRIGYFDGYGTITLRGLIHFLCSHDLEHLASLRWLLGKIEERDAVN